jgi:hypothetical protein
MTRMTRQALNHSVGYQLIAGLWLLQGKAFRVTALRAR